MDKYRIENSAKIYRRCAAVAVSARHVLVVTLIALFGMIDSAPAAARDGRDLGQRCQFKHEYDSEGLGPFGVTAIPVRSKDPAIDFTIYAPVKLDDSENDFWEGKCISLITWGNGLFARGNSKKYESYFHRWASFGFMIIAEEADTPLTLSAWLPTLGLESFKDGFELRPDNGNSGAAGPAVLPVTKGQLSGFVISAGKSRGGNQAINALNRIEDASAALCIGGCSVGKEDGNYKPALFITGEQDFARWFVHRAFKSSPPPKYFFKRKYIECKKKDKVTGESNACIGTHLGLDQDEEVAILTTRWLRCIAYGKGCRRISEIGAGEGLAWAKIAIDVSSAPPRQ